MFVRSRFNFELNLSVEIWNQMLLLGQFLSSFNHFLPFCCHFRSLPAPLSLQPPPDASSSLCLRSWWRIGAASE